MSMWLRAVALALACAHAASAPISCWNNSACPSSAPYCLPWAQQTTLVSTMHASQRLGLDVLDANVDHIQGFCVQCSSDCHCGVNQYCGIDPNAATRVTMRALTAADIPALSLNIDDSLKDELNYAINASQGLVGLPLPSVCLSYTVPSAPCVQQEDQTLAWGPFEYVTGLLNGTVTQYTSTRPDGFGNATIKLLQTFKLPSGGISKTFAESGKFCGALSPTTADLPGVAPAFFSSVGTFSTATATTLPANHQYFMNTNNAYAVSFCSKSVLFSGKGLGSTYQDYNMIGATCDGFGYGTSNFRIRFSSPAIAWTGTCMAGACQVCNNGDKRCTNSLGVPQICINGQWVEFKAYLSEQVQYMQYASSDSFYNSNRMVSALTALIPIALFIALIFAAVVGICAAVAARANGKPETPVAYNQQPAKERPTQPVPAGSGEIGSPTQV